MCAPARSAPGYRQASLMISRQRRRRYCFHCRAQRAQLPGQRLGGQRYCASDQSGQGSNRNDQCVALQVYVTLSRTNDEANWHIPIILLTSKDMASDRVWALRQGQPPF